MRGRYERRTWPHDPDPVRASRVTGAPQLRRVPAGTPRRVGAALSAETSAVVSDAEQALPRLGIGQAKALAPLARLLLRTESIASSKVEGLQVDARDLARAEARADTGRQVGADRRPRCSRTSTPWSSPSTTRPRADVFGADADHARSTRASWRTRPTRASPGGPRPCRTGSAATTTTPCGADFVPPAARARRRRSWTTCARSVARRDAAAAGAGRARARAVRDDPPVRRRQRPHGPRARPRRAPPARAGAASTCRRQRRARARPGPLHRRADGLPRRTEIDGVDRALRRGGAAGAARSRGVPGRGARP